MAAMASCKRSWAPLEEQGDDKLPTHFLENELMEREFDGELLNEDDLDCEPDSESESESEPDTCEKHLEDQARDRRSQIGCEGEVLFCFF